MAHLCKQPGHSNEVLFRMSTAMTTRSDTAKDETSASFICRQSWLYNKYLSLQYWDPEGLMRIMQSVSGLVCESSECTFILKWARAKVGQVSMLVLRCHSLLYNCEALAFELVPDLQSLLKWASQASKTRATAIQPKLGDSELNKFLFISLWNPDIDTKHYDTDRVTPLDSCYVGLVSLQGQVLRCRVPHAATCDYINCGESQLRLGSVLQPFHKQGAWWLGYTQEYSYTSTGGGVTLHSPLGG